MSLGIQDFDFELPQELIAQHPASPRDHARLLVYDRATGTIEDRFFYELGSYIPSNTTMVVNNSRVEKCRLLFQNGSKELSRSDLAPLSDELFPRLHSVWCHCASKIDSTGKVKGHDSCAFN